MWGLSIRKTLKSIGNISLWVGIEHGAWGRELISDCVFSNKQSLGREERKIYIGFTSPGFWILPPGFSL